MFETDAWPFIQARDFGVKRTVPVKYITIHTPEFPEGVDSARKVAAYFKHPDKPSSSNIVVDNAEIIQCVKDSYVAYAAPGVNHNGIQVELMGYMNQTRAQWRDVYSLQMLALAADAVAQYCLKYTVPPIKLIDTELAAGEKKGIIGHDQASRVFKQSDHTDPGPNFPWRRFICMVTELRAERQLIA